jgi:hypothetical protein
VAIRASLHRQGLLTYKEEIISSFTKERTVHIGQMTRKEARALLQMLNESQNEQNKSLRLMKKLFAMAHELGWIKEETHVKPNGETFVKKNYTTVYKWVEQYGYLKKPLRKYSYNELPKLVSQFEIGPYQSFIKK